MHITEKIKKASYILAIAFLLIGVIPFTAFTGVTTVYADDGDEPPVAEEAPAGEAADSEPAAGSDAGTPADDAEVPEDEPDAEAEGADESAETEDEAAGEAVEDEVAADVVQVAGETEESAEAATNDAEQPALAEAAASETAELLEVMNESGLQLADENGEPLELASQEAAEIMAGTDPFFWNGSSWVGYTEDGTGCPTNVTCYAAPNPLQKAVDEAGANNTIYIATGDYDADVTVNHAGQVYKAFQTVTVTAPDVNTVSIDASGYAVVRSLTLKADVDSVNSLGFYADEVIVDGAAGGRLADGLNLVNTSNPNATIKADVILKSDGAGYYMIQDAYHATSTDPVYEWECGEPDEKIWPGRTYRMKFMSPRNTNILDYYSNSNPYAPDERDDDIEGGITYLDAPLSAEERLMDLLISVNVSEGTPAWNWDDEKLIFWYLLGNTGTSSTGEDMTLSLGQLNWARSITDGSNDNIDLDFGIWFLWPLVEYPGTGSELAVGAYGTNARQLTFISLENNIVGGCMDPAAPNYDPNATYDNGQCVFYGCTDPGALNYDPNANTNDGSCTYDDGSSTPPPTALTVPGFVIPVTGAGGPTEELFIIPVTGVDLREEGALDINWILLAAGILLLAVGVILKKKEVPAKVTETIDRF